MLFSIITTALNPGDKLQKTLQSILEQTCVDYEVIVKDGGSTDGSLTFLEGNTNPRISIYSQKDSSVYDGMNQALLKVAGDYVLFLNCGDVFGDCDTLQRTADEIDTYRKQHKDDKPVIFYGDTFCVQNQVTDASPGEITGFTCFRNIPCHQSCFYDRRLFVKKKYDLSLKIRADYDHFLWCFYQGGASFVYMPFTVAIYEGGGISETAENYARDKEEHTLIVKRYMGKGELLKYRCLMALTLAPLRRALAHSTLFSGIYHRLKKRLYR